MHKIVNIDVAEDNSNGIRNNGLTVSRSLYWLLKFNVHRQLAGFLLTLASIRHLRYLCMTRFKIKASNMHVLG